MSKLTFWTPQSGEEYISKIHEKKKKNISLSIQSNLLVTSSCWTVILIVREL